MGNYLLVPDRDSNRCQGLIISIFPVQCLGKPTQSTLEASLVAIPGCENHNDHIHVYTYLYSYIFTRSYVGNTRRSEDDDKCCTWICLSKKIGKTGEAQLI